MSVIAGCAGEVHIQADDGSWLVVGETQRWQITESCTVLKRKRLNSCGRRPLDSKDKVWIFSAGGLLDNTDPGQALMQNGQFKRFRVYVSTERDNYFYEGEALIHSKTRSGDAEGEDAKWAIAAQGHGHLNAPGLVPTKVRAYANSSPIQYPTGAYVGAYQH